MTYLIHHKKIGFWGFLLIAAGLALDSVLGVASFLLAAAGVLLVLSCLFSRKDERGG